MSTEKISITCPATYVNKVQVIKAIRMLSGYGLKEAKDASEIVGRPIIFELYRQNFNSYPDPNAEIEHQYRVLRAQGVQVGTPIYQILEDLRKLGAEALLQGEDELANEILQLVLVEKLRRRGY